MVNLTYLALILLLSTQILASKSIDLVGPLQISAFSWLSSNYTNAIVRANIIGQSSSKLDPAVISTIQNAKSGGLTPDIYINLCRGLNPTDQINAIVSNITANFNNLWIKIVRNSVSGCSWEGYTQQGNCIFATQAINTAISLKGQQIGIYSSYSTWKTLFGAKCDTIGQLNPVPKLWYYEYNSTGVLDTSISFQNYKTFGGLISPFLKQVSGSKKIPLFANGIMTANVNQNWSPYPLLIDTNLSHIEGLLILKFINRAIDGSGNNIFHTEWGKSYTDIVRKGPARYQDGKSKMLQNLPNPRFLSEAISKLPDNIVIPNEFNLTMLWGTWGQFLDHDMSLTNVGTTEPQAISIPRCDKYFDPNCTGTKTIPWHRSKFNNNKNIRTNINELTAWIDAGMIYGSTLEVNNKVRTFQNGKLKTSAGDMLPIDQNGKYYAGDVRATENMGLTSLQIVFLREHNRLCDEIIAANGNLNDNEVFRIARNYVIGLIQKISFYDFLPNLFGQQNFNTYIGPYKGYNSSVNPAIMTEFSSVAFRIGHPYIPRTYKAVDDNNVTVQTINLLYLMYVNPQTFTPSRFNTILKGLSFTLAKRRTLDYVDQLRNIPAYIMGGNFDLFAINTVRGRDHGVSDYNTLRQVFGLDKFTTFDEIFADPFDQFANEQSYNSIDNIDSYVGVLGQFKLSGSMYGQLGATIAGEQFSNLRNGDRLWFQNAYPASIVQEIWNTSLTDIILRNTVIKNMPTDGFFCNNCSVN